MGLIDHIICLKTGNWIIFRLEKYNPNRGVSKISLLFWKVLATEYSQLICYSSVKRKIECAITEFMGEYSYSGKTSRRRRRRSGRALANLMIPSQTQRGER